MPTLTITVTPTAPKRGDTVTATYIVTGNDGTPAGTPTVHILEGEALFDGQPAQVSTVITLPGAPAVPPAVEVFAAPTCDGLTFTGGPKVWTAVVA